MLRQIERTLQREADLHGRLEPREGGGMLAAQHVAGPRQRIGQAERRTLSPKPWRISTPAISLRSPKSRAAPRASISIV